MANLFLFMNSFCARMIIPFINEIVNFDVDNVLLLNENYSEDISKKVIWVNSLSEALHKSDMIWLMKDDIIPKDSIDYIMEHAATKNIQCYSFENYWIDSISADIILDDYNNVDYANRPSVLIVAVGCLSQQFLGEMHVNRIFHDAGINFKQIFSAKTKRFFTQLSEYGLLNEIVETMLHPMCGYDVVVSCIDIGSKTYSLSDMYNLVKMISPDFTILQSDAKFCEYDYINSYLEIVNHSEIGFYIKSHYSLLDERTRVYYKKLPNSNARFYNIDDEGINKALFFEIFSHIAYPKGMVIL